MYELDTIHNLDALEFLSGVPDASIDLVLSDLPYAQTENTWDNLIPLTPLFDHLKRIIKPNGAVLLTAMQPFTSMLIYAGGLDFYRYEWVLGKHRKTNFLNAKNMPLREHETLQVFYHGLPTYNPQKVPGGHYNVSNKVSSNASTQRIGTQVKRRNWRIFEENQNRQWSDFYYPGTIQYFKPDPENFQTFTQVPDKSITYPTQKPLKMGRYFIRTYSNPGDIVLDMTCGSGTFGVAAALENRHYLLNDNGTCEVTGRLWADIARERIARDTERIRAYEAARDPMQDNPPDENNTRQKSLFQRDNDV